MIASIIISLIALLFALWGSRGKNSNGLAIAFILLTIFSCLRYNFGTDYMSYMKDFEDAEKFTIDYILSNKGFKDKGWFIIEMFLYPLGWFIFASIISIYSNYIYYRFIKKYAPKRYYWLSFFVYAFTFDMFLLQQSMIRQGWAIALVLNAYMLLDDVDRRHKKKIIWVLVLFALAISIHKSAAFTLPFLLLKFMPLRWGKFMALGMITVFFMLFAVKGLLETYLSEILMMDAFATFGSDYGEESGTQIGIRAILECVPIFVSGYYLCLKRTENGPRFIVAVSMIAPMVMPLATIIHMISRVAYYFSIFYLVAIPITYKEIRNKVMRAALLVLFMGLTLYVYFDRFDAESYRKPYAEYHTIFSTLFQQY